MANNPNAVAVSHELAPATARRVRANFLSTSQQPLEIGRLYLLQHTTRQVCAAVTGMNEFGEYELECHQPLYFDPSKENGLAVIDPAGNAILATGVILSASESNQAAPSGDGLTVWFTGLSSAGKSTISKAVYETLRAQSHQAEWLDGDAMRQTLSRGLGFSKQDRDENVRRIGFAAELLTRRGVIALVSLISPYRNTREEMRGRIRNFLEVYVHAPLEVCEQRDVKGLYRRARAGEIPAMTGIDDPYEPPLAPDLECRTDRETVEESSAKVIGAVKERLAELRAETCKSGA